MKRNPVPILPSAACAPLRAARDPTLTDSRPIARRAHIGIQSPGTARGIGRQAESTHARHCAPIYGARGSAPIYPPSRLSAHARGQTSSTRTRETSVSSRFRPETRTDVRINRTDVRLSGQSSAESCARLLRSMPSEIFEFPLTTCAQSVMIETRSYPLRGGTR